MIFLQGPWPRTTAWASVGALKQGYSNHHYLRRARFVGKTLSPPDFQLFDLGDYPGAWMPGAQSLQGEVYEVDALTLASLDHLEEVPRVYRREKLQTEYGHAFVYVLQRMPRGARRCNTGSWRGS
ncbi:gamma-glutamylcyclotransferase [Alcanivorax sp.]|uniref:gamma-glutamylcyclotransferase family protein n=1 Tax=Alcanivorax sp. TaxID=1872427 RepID=UPI0025BF09F6|nr:gamma-glutamylcyclotransferase [Alcanivorax sp.]